jgi:hypothetical protein
MTLTSAEYFQKIIKRDPKYYCKNSKKFYDLHKKEILQRKKKYYEFKKCIKELSLIEW